MAHPAQEPLLPARDETGLPKTSEFGDFKTPGLVAAVVITTLSAGLGQAAAWPIYIYLSSSKVEPKISLLAEYELGWLYLSLFLLRVAHGALNSLVVEWRRETKVGVPDQHVYKVFTPPGKEPLPYVLMAEEGALGCFNRAQRA
eukprot:EG_transcript_43017